MTTPEMHAALARLVNNEETRKQEKINQIPKRSILGIVVTVAIVVAAVAREASTLRRRAQVGGVGAHRESNDECLR